MATDSSVIVLSATEQLGERGPLGEAVFYIDECNDIYQGESASSLCLSEMTLENTEYDSASETTSYVIEINLSQEDEEYSGAVSGLVQGLEREKLRAFTRENRLKMDCPFPPESDLA